MLFCAEQAPGAASYTSKGGGTPSSLEAQLDWLDDTGTSQARPGATSSSQASPAPLSATMSDGAGFNMAAAVAAAAVAEPEGYAQRPLATWSVEEVCEWLADVVQLPQHTDAFKEHGIDGRSRCCAVDCLHASWLRVAIGTACPLPPDIGLRKDFCVCGRCAPLHSPTRPRFAVGVCLAGFLLSRLVKDDLDDLGEFTGLAKTKVIARRDEAAMVGGGRRDPRVSANAYGARLDTD